MCRNDELSSTMSWVGCSLKDSELFVLFAENSQIHSLNFHVSGSTKSVSKQPTQLIIAAHNCHIFFFSFLIPYRRNQINIEQFGYIVWYNIQNVPIKKHLQVHGLHEFH